MWEYQAVVDHVHDGDTITFLIDKGMYDRSVEAIRFAAVDAPELDTQRGKDARTFVEGWILQHQLHPQHAKWPFIIVTEKDTRTFNRYVGVIRCATCAAVLNDDVNAWLKGGGT